MKIIITEAQHKRLFEEDDLETSINKIKGLIDSGGDANIELAFSMASMFGEEVENEVLLYWINKFAEPYDTNFIFKKEYLETIRELNMTHNQLSFLPDSIGKLVNLEILYLGANQLSSLPDSIGNMTNLKRLDLTNNQLTSLPESIGRLTNLEELYLTGNQLTSLPDWIGRLTNLKVLNLSNNQLSEEEKSRIKQLLPKTTIHF